MSELSLSLLYYVDSEIKYSVLRLHHAMVQADDPTLDFRLGSPEFKPRAANVIFILKKSCSGTGILRVVRRLLCHRYFKHVYLSRYRVTATVQRDSLLLPFLVLLKQF